jgi:hypothetical protein
LWQRHRGRYRKPHSEISEFEITSSNIHYMLVGGASPLRFEPGETGRPTPWRRPTDSMSLIPKQACNAPRIESRLKPSKPKTTSNVPFIFRQTNRRGQQFNRMDRRSALPGTGHEPYSWVPHPRIVMPLSIRSGIPFLACEWSDVGWWAECYLSEDDPEVSSSRESPERVQKRS